jgi:hypothetical protein
MRKIKLFLVLTALLSVWLCPNLILAQPALHGALSGTIGPGTYICDGNCRILSGQTLTIAPGTTVLFNGHYTWDIYGQINAIGTEADPIQFLRQDPVEEQRWGGFRFQSGASNSSVFEYCIIDNCKNITTPNYNGGGIYSYGVALTIRNTTISNCQASYGGGIYAYSGAQISLDNCMIIKNNAGNGGGIYLYNCPGSEILNSIIARNISTST